MTNLRRLIFGSDIDDIVRAKDEVIASQQDQITFLRAQLEKAQDRIIRMADPLLEARLVAVEKARQPVPPRAAQASVPLPHNPRLLGLAMEGREREAAVAAAVERDPVDVERGFRRRE